MGILRDVFRRRGRSILTVSGVAIGVFALVVLGSASENNRVYIDRLTGYFDGVISVIDARDMSVVGMGAGERPLLMDLKPKLEAYPGVDKAFPVVTSLIDDDYFSLMPPVVLSVTPGMWDGYLDAKAAKGRLIDGTTPREVVLGSDIAAGRKLDVGDVMTIRDTRFTVAGILDRTYVNLSDSAAYVPLADAQRLFWLTLPEVFRDAVKPEDLAVQYSVTFDEGVDGDALASKLERDFSDVKATGPTELMGTARGLVDLLTSVVFGISIVALIVCTLSIVNTMTISVGERTREIGLRRALGASRARVAGEVLTESALMSGIGGVIGATLGALAVTGINSAIIASTGTSSLLITGRLIFIALAFAVGVGLLGGLFPARSAARLDPAAALIYE